MVQDVKEFKVNFDEKGPKVKGISPKEASNRLAHSATDFGIKKTFYEINRKGEDLFGLHNQEYPDLIMIENDIAYLSQLYDLYNKVNGSTEEWEERTWTQVNRDVISDWEDIITKYSEQFQRLPSDLRRWPAAKDLKAKIDNYKDLLPFVRDLKNDNIKERHWEEIIKIAKGGDPDKEINLNYKDHDNFIFKDLIEANLLAYREDLEDIISTAKKQQKIQKNKDEIIETWEKE